MKRRHALETLAGGVAALAAGAPRRALADDHTLHFGLTAVILRNQRAFLASWRIHLEGRLGRPVRFVQRRSYREITELVVTGEVDVAWVCGFPYVRNRDRMRLLAVPVWNGQPLYRSYLIVPSDDQHARSFADLAGRVFAYSDPDSNSGYLVPRYEMLRARLRPGQLFRKTFFTWSHLAVVRAVAEGLAQAGAVDGYIWETIRKREPRLAARTRVVQRSEWYGFPPLVARRDLPDAQFARVQRTLFSMQRDAQGAPLLDALNLDGFGPADEHLFDGIERVVRFVDEFNASRT